jgi:hypothetical protein
MSTFLGFESYLVPLGASIQTVQDTFATAFAAPRWAPSATRRTRSTGWIPPRQAPQPYRPC